MMHVIHLSELQRNLDEAVVGKLCIQAWLGYANVLFVGFGNKVLPHTLPGEPHIHPPYQLQSSYADWSIEDEHGVIGDADDEYVLAEAVVNRLVGCRAVSWRFVDSSLQLIIEFDGGLKLEITTMAEADRDLSQKDAWNLRMSDDYYRIVKWDGTIYVMHKDEVPEN